MVSRSLKKTNTLAVVFIFLSHRGHDCVTESTHKGSHRAGGRPSEKMLPGWSGSTSYRRIAPRIATGGTGGGGRARGRDLPAAPARARADPRRRLRLAGATWSSSPTTARSPGSSSRPQRRARARARRRRGGRRLRAGDAVPRRLVRAGRLARVVEHLQDDLAALRELRRVVAPGGALLVTVPAYQWLWSGHDEINHHHRRYTRNSLLASRAKPAGSPCARPTSTRCFCPSRSLLRILDRFSRKTTESSLDLWVPPPLLNWLLERPLALEASADRPGRAHSRRAVFARRVGFADAASAAMSAICVTVRRRSPGLSSMRILNVHALLAANVITVTIAVVGICPTSSSIPRPSTNRYTSPRLQRQPAGLHDRPAHRRRAVARRAR